MDTAPCIPRVPGAGSLPHVSVLIPNYNHARFLPETINSVLMQDFHEFEIVIVDNCSDDGSQQVIRDFAAKDKRIRCEFNQSNIGMVANFNHCLSLARGPYIQFMLSDDKFTRPDSLGKMVRLLDEHPSAVMAVCARSLIDESSVVVGCHDHLETAGLHRGADVIMRCLRTNNNLIGEPTVVMMRRSGMTRQFSLDYEQLTDLEMWCHLLQFGDLVYTKEPLCAFRRHAAQQSALNARRRMGEQEHLALLFKYMHAPWWLTQRELDQFLFYQIYHLRRQARMNEEETARARKMLEMLGRQKYETMWIKYKITRPFVNLGTSISKRIHRNEPQPPQRYVRYERCA